MDIRMPGVDGLQAAQQLAQQENPPAIIFCTAYDEYAISAFDVQAVGYVLKPVRRPALLDALCRAQRISRVQLSALLPEQNERCHLTDWHAQARHKDRTARLNLKPGLLTVNSVQSVTNIFQCHAVPRTTVEPPPPLQQRGC